VSRRTAVAKVKSDADKARVRKVARAEALLALIDRRKASIVESFYDVGEALRELLASKLYVVLGYTSFEKMLTERDVVGHATAKELITIVNRTPREIALLLGKAKAIELVRWTRETEAVDTVASVVRDNEAIDGVPAREISARGIARARRELVAAKRKAAGQVDPVERSAARTARVLQAWLRRRGARGAVAAPRRGSDGWLVSVLIPVSAAEKLMGDSAG
jgi:hypothetical protein